MRLVTWCFLVILLLASVIVPEANAYVGPGPGLSVLGALWAVIAAVLLALLAVIRWPLRFLLRKLRKKSGPEITDTGSAHEEQRSDK
jgi:hypothetical protein